MKITSRSCCRIILFIQIPVCFAFMGCAINHQRPVRILGSPEHHTLNGIKLIKKGRTDAARREFSYALERGEDFSPAQRGMALVYALEGDYPSAFEAVHSAVRHTEKESAREDIHKAFDHLRVGESAGEKIRGNGNRLVQSKYFIKYFLDVYYYAGVAFRTGGEYRVLESVLTEALRVNRAFLEEAERQMQLFRTMKESNP